MTQANKFHCADGLPTAYALACGYVAQCESNGNRLTLWHEGGPCFHVRQHNHVTGERVFWESFPTITAAKKRYREAWAAMR